MAEQIIPKMVRDMLDAPGIYVGTDIYHPGSAVIIASVDGKLIVMQKDKELDPTRFLDGFVIKHGPLLP